MVYSWCSVLNWFVVFVPDESNVFGVIVLPSRPCGRHQLRETLLPVD
jgi:hypothetical protein